MSQPDYDAAIAHVLDRLRRELSPQLTYHDLWHTKHDVLPAVARLGAISGLPAHDIRLLEVAAAYHDSGFLVTYEEHERAGIKIVRHTLPQFGFREQEIAQIAGLIRATRLPQSPQNYLQELLVDADLDVLGRDDFFDRNELLRQELALLDGAVPWREWQKQQIQFLQQHTYFTPVARDLRDDGKRRHIHTIQDWLRRGFVNNGSSP